MAASMPPPSSTICDGRDMRQEPIERRKQMLVELLRRTKPTALLLSEHDEGDAARLFEQACKMGLEGLVSKRKGSRDTSGRSRDWIKSKNPDHRSVVRVLEEDWG